MKIFQFPILMLFSLICLLTLGIERSAAQNIIETDSLGTFTALEISGPIKVDLIPSDQNRMQITLWGIDIKNIKWVNKDNTLSVTTRKALVNKRATAEIKLYYRELNRIIINGGEVTTKEPIVCGSLYLAAESSAGKMNLITECSDVTIHTSGKNTITVSGIAEYVTCNAKLGSRISCLDLSATNVDATASSKAEIQVRVNDVLEAKANTGGNIFFVGDPLTVNVKKSTMGGVESINNL